MSATMSVPSRRASSSLSRSNTTGAPWTLAMIAGLLQRAGPVSNEKAGRQRHKRGQMQQLAHGVPERADQPRPGETVFAPAHDHLSSRGYHGKEAFLAL